MKNKSKQMETLIKKDKKWQKNVIKVTIMSQTSVCVCACVLEVGLTNRGLEKFPEYNKSGFGSPF